MQYMIIDAETDQMVDFIELQPAQKASYEDAHPEYYLLEDEEIYDLDEDYDDFEDEDD